MNSTIVKVIIWIAVLTWVSFWAYTYMNFSIDSKIVSMQQDMLNEIYNLTSFKETWKITTSFDYSMWWSIWWWVKWNYDFNNYIANQVFLDSSFSTDISWKVNIDLFWFKQEISLTTFLEFVFKDYSDYIKIKDTKIDWLKDNPMLASYSEMVDKVIKKVDWKFVLLNTEESLKKFTYIYLKEKMSKPMMVLDRKEWSKYYVVPSKDMCDFLNELSGKEKCSEEEYKTWVSEFKKENELYINYELFWDKFLSYNIKEKAWSWNIDLKVYLNSWVDWVEMNSLIEWITWKIVYKKWENIDLKVEWKQYNLNLDFVWKLNSKNIFENWKFSFNYWDDFNSNIVFENWNISWDTSIVMSSLIDLKIKTTWKYSANSYELKNNFDSKLNYIWSSISWNLDISSIKSWDNRKDNLTLDVKYDEMNFKLDVKTDVITSKKVDTIKIPESFEKVEDVIK